MQTVKLGSVAKSSTKKGKEYPVFDGNRSLVNKIVDKDRQIKVLEGEVKRFKDELKEEVFPVAAQHIKDGSDELGVSAVGDTGSVLVVYTAAYKSGADLEKVEEVIGKKNTDKLFRQRFSLKVDGDVLTENIGVVKTGKLVNELVELFAKYGVSEALTSKEDFVPVGVRELFTALSVEEATALNEVFAFPATAGVK